MLIQHRGQFKRLKYELAPLIAVIPKVPLLSSLVFYLKYIYKITYLLNFYYYPNKIRKGFRVFSSDYSMARFSLPAKIRKRNNIKVNLVKFFIQKIINLKLLCYLSIIMAVYTMHRANCTKMIKRCFY